ncbi:MAG TPA: AAA family ATPase [Gaiellaceae bacterium]|nr:AAA family ATPase [Gaiellaceae bacterium]
MSASVSPIRTNRLPATSFPLLESKLTPPPLREGTIQRTALVNRLRAARGMAVTSVTAPPGYGKTTLLAEWTSRDDRPLAWLSLDETDNDPVTLLTYLAAALNRAAPLDESVFHALCSRGAPVRSVVARIGQSLAERGTPVVLVLDDVHLVKDRATVDTLRTFVDQLPAESQVALASRRAPSLPLARLRAEGQLFEIGVEELRLADREAAALLRAAGLDLTPTEVAELNRHTEGWPAGLYLAALALRTTGGPRPAARFGGADRFVSDYFRLELLSSLPKRDVQFLTRTSLLDRMCGSLCDAVLETSGSARDIESLERSNLFLVPLDNERRWYRYHHLFRDMLRDELQRREPELVASINTRAADWSEANGDPESAIAYAQAAGDRDRVVALVGAAAVPVYQSGRFATVERWLTQLDDAQLLERHPAISVLGAWMHALAGRPEAADRWADAAARSSVDVPMPDGSLSTRSWQALLRTVMCRDGVERMQEDAQIALGTLASGSTWRSYALLGLGVSHVLAGDAEGADPILAEVFELAAATSTIDIASIALAQRSLLAANRGDWPAAEELALRARDLVHEARLDDYVASAMAFVASARSALRHSDWVRSRDDMDRAGRLVPQLTYALPWLAVQVRLELTRAQLSLADSAGAETLLTEVDELLARRPALGVLGMRANELRDQLESVRRPDGGWPSTLTGAELRLLPLLTTHLSFREIAERLYVSRNTVKTQAISVYRKLGVSSRSDAIARAEELDLVDPAAALSDADLGRTA